jgi:hypothetical protein
MRHLVDIVAFWAVLFVAIRLLAQFPDSLLARVMFSQQGPLPIRGEARSDYLLRWSAYWGGWLTEVLVVFGTGWVALRWDASLGDSMVFLVFWAVVVPLLGGVAILGALFAFAASCWIRRFGRDPPSPVEPVGHVDLDR